MRVARLEPGTARSSKMFEISQRPFAGVCSSLSSSFVLEEGETGRCGHVIEQSKTAGEHPLHLLRILQIRFCLCGAYGLNWSRCGR
jgi:hypothetical protein